MQYAKPTFPVHLSTIRCVTPLQVHCIQLASIMLIRRFHPNVYIYINIILFNDSDLFKFLLIHSLFLSYFAELKFPVQCTDDSWAVGSEVIVAIFRLMSDIKLHSAQYRKFDRNIFQHRRKGTFNRTKWSYASFIFKIPIRKSAVQFPSLPLLLLGTLRSETRRL